MADEHTERNELRRINWSECFGFVALFRTFRLSLHLSKLGLAFAGVVLTLVVGLLMDLIWETATETGGIFAGFISFQASHLLALCMAVLNVDWFGGLVDAIQAGPTAELEGVGAVAHLVLMIKAVLWLLVEHIWFAVIFYVIVLAIWSLAGGAICRIAALDAARDEKLPLKQAVSFAARKFPSFSLAPLIGLGFVLVLGVCLIIGGLVGSIPYVGEVVTTPLLIFGLLAGAIVTAILIGLFGGGGLMWPTIAAEGSDAFDAISRSFSYVYTKPWRSILYALVTLAYGAICYLFVRLFIWLTLLLTRTFVAIGMMATSRELFEEANKLDVMWPRPAFGHLVSTPDTFYAHMQGWDYFGACLIWFWGIVLAISVYAFLFSFYFSGCTMIYLLLRREVDMTDMDDVYVEEAPEEEAPMAAPTAETPAAAAAAPPAEAPPPETPAPPAPPAETPPPSETKPEEPPGESDTSPPNP